MVAPLFHGFATAFLQQGESRLRRAGSFRNYVEQRRKEAREREWAVCQGSDKYTGEGHSRGTSWRPQKHKWCQGLGCPRSRIYMPLKPTMFILSQCVHHLLAHTGLSLGYLAAPPATSYQLSVRRWHFGGFSSALYLIGAQHITPQSGSGSTSLKLMS